MVDFPALESPIKKGEADSKEETMISLTMKCNTV